MKSKNMQETNGLTKLTMSSARDLITHNPECRSSRSRVKECNGMLLLSNMQFLKPIWSQWAVVGFLAEGVSVDTLNAELEALADAAGWPKPIDLA